MVERFWKISLSEKEKGIWDGERDGEGRILLGPAPGSSVLSESFHHILLCPSFLSLQFSGLSMTLSRL